MPNQHQLPVLLHLQATVSHPVAPPFPAADVEGFISPTTANLVPTIASKLPSRSHAHLTLSSKQLSSAPRSKSQRFVKPGCQSSTKQQSLQHRSYVIPNDQFDPARNWFFFFAEIIFASA